MQWIKLETKLQRLPKILMPWRALLGAPGLVRKGQMHKNHRLWDVQHDREHYQQTTTTSRLNSNRLLSFERKAALFLCVLVLVGAEPVEEALHSISEM